MNALPLIHRELLVASRRASTWGLRLGVGLLAMLIFLLIVGAGSAANLQPSTLGSSLFGTLSFIAFLLTGLSGARSAGIPLCEENRENTLGLLLLTPLRRHELVLGKLAVATLQGLAGLLAFVPVLSLALTVGGITINQLWMAAFTVGIMLLLSNAAGLYVAAIRTTELPVVLRTIGLVLVACLPCGWFFIAVALTGDLDARLPDKSGKVQSFSWGKLGVVFCMWLTWVTLFLISINMEPITLILFANPAYLFFLSLSAGSPLVFLMQAAGVLSCIACLLWVTSLRLAAIGRDDREANPFFPEAAPILTVPSSDKPLAGQLAGAHQPVRMNQHERPGGLLDESPFLWWLYPTETRRLSIWIATITLGLAGFHPLFHHVRFEFLAPLFVPVFIASAVLAYVLDYLIAQQAARLLADARHSGSLELLLVTPEFRKQAIRDIWRSLRATFLKPVLVMFALRLLGTVLALFFVTDSHAIQREYGLPLFLARTLCELMSLAALAWLGIWESWHSRRPAFAATKTFIIASLLPLILSLPFARLGLMWHFSTLVWQAVMLVLFIGLAMYARTRVQNTFLAGSPPVELRRS